MKLLPELLSVIIGFASIIYGAYSLGVEHGRKEAITKLAKDKERAVAMKCLHGVKLEGCE
jgi:hypothetical protein